MSGKIYEPIEPPTAHFLSDPRADLTEEERTMYSEVLEHFSKHDHAIPGLEKGELTEMERFFISYECILRWVGMHILVFIQHLYPHLDICGPLSGLALNPQ